MKSGKSARRMRKDRSKSLRAQLPDKGLYRFFSSVLLRAYSLRCPVKVTNGLPADLKPPFIAISNHPSFYDWIFLAAAVRPHMLNVITTRYYYYNRLLAPLLKALGAIPKNLFSPDMQTVREALRVLRKGGCIGLFPEGRLSPHGCSETINPSTLRFLKKTGVPVVSVRVEGSYLARPKWSKGIRRGAVYVESKLLFTPQELKTGDTQELSERLEKALAYDEFEARRRRGTSFRGKNFARGLENILYICPVCRSQFTIRTDRDHIRCAHCGAEAVLNGEYAFIPAGRFPEDIRKWFDFQKDCEAAEIGADPGFSFGGEVTLKRPLCGPKMFTKAGSGYAQLDRQGLHYTGTQFDRPFRLDVPIRMLTALPFGAGCDFEINYDGNFYYFEPEDLRKCVKWSVIAEQLYAEYQKTGALQK